MSTTYNETRVNLAKVIAFDADGKTPKLDPKTGEVITSTEENLVEKKATELIAAQKAAGQEEPELAKVQTFGYTEVSGDTLSDVISDFTALIQKYQTDDAKAAIVAKGYINRGVVLAQQKVVREFMLDENQVAVEGVFDLMPDAAQPGEGRRKADPRSQAAKALSTMLGRTITVEEVDNLLASFNQPAAV
jgi:hypothetical protein